MRLVKMGSRVASAGDTDLGDCSATSILTHSPKDIALLLESSRSIRHDENTFTDTNVRGDEMLLVLLKFQLTFDLITYPIYGTYRLFGTLFRMKIRYSKFI